jgi:putative ABC transport system ATP-binding protein
MRVLEAFDLYRFYHAEEEETLALRGVSLYVEAGELVAVMSPSGCGKTTLLACLAGLDEPDGGYVILNGSRLTRRPETERATRRGTEIGIMLQSDNLIGHLSVEDNIRLQMRLVHRLDEHWLKELISLVGLRERYRAYPPELSGGEAARAGLAVALAAAPKVLLADEPTGEVDAETEDHILRLFDARRTNGDATLVATHSRALAERADRIINLLDGRVIDG